MTTYTHNHAYHTLALELYQQRAKLCTQLDEIADMQAKADLCKARVTEVEKALTTLGYDPIAALEYAQTEGL